MKLSLREARKLETRIQAKVNEGVVNGRALNIHEEFLRSSEETNYWLNETFSMGEDSASVLIGLVQARSTIRRKVQETNESVGVNELVAQRKELIAIRSIWGEVVQGYDVENGHALTPNVLQQMTKTAKESAKNSPASGYGRRNDVLTVGAISDSLHERAESIMRVMLRDIDRVEDKLSGLNATTRIELEEKLVSFLEENDLL